MAYFSIIGMGLHIFCKIGIVHSIKRRNLLLIIIDIGLASI